MDEKILKPAGFADFEKHIVKNPAPQKRDRQRLLKEYVAVSLLAKYFLFNKK